MRACSFWKTELKLGDYWDCNWHWHEVPLSRVATQGGVNIGKSHNILTKYACFDEPNREHWNNVEQVTNKTKDYNGGL